MPTFTDTTTGYAGPVLISLLFIAGLGLVAWSRRRTLEHRYDEAGRRYGRALAQANASRLLLPQALCAYDDAVRDYTLLRDSRLSHMVAGRLPETLLWSEELGLDLPNGQSPWPGQPDDGAGQMPAPQGWSNEVAEPSASGFYGYPEPFLDQQGHPVFLMDAGLAMGQTAVMPAASARPFSDQMPPCNPDPASQPTQWPVYRPSARSPQAAPAGNSGQGQASDPGRGA